MSIQWAGIGWFNNAQDSHAEFSDETQSLCSYCPTLLSPLMFPLVVRWSWLVLGSRCLTKNLIAMPLASLKKRWKLFRQFFRKSLKTSAESKEWWEELLGINRCRSNTFLVIRLHCGSTGCIRDAGGWLFLFVCLFACLLTCLLACLLVCLLACLLACLLVCLFVCLCVCVFVCLCVCVFVCLCVCVFVCLCVCLFVCLIACLFACLLACLLACLFACLLVCLFVCLFICLFVCWPQ